MGEGVFPALRFKKLISFLIVPFTYIHSFVFFHLLIVVCVFVVVVKLKSG